MKKTAKKKESKLRGASRMREFGYRRVETWFDAGELVSLKAAAEAAGMHLATYVRRAAVDLALVGGRPSRH